MSERTEGFWRRLKRLDKRAASALWWVFGWIGVPILAVSAVWFSAQDIGPAWSAAHGRGQHGVFLAQQRQ
jgi:hypothetical protein